MERRDFLKGLGWGTAGAAISVAGAAVSKAEVAGKKAWWRHLWAPEASREEIADTVADLHEDDFPPLRFRETEVPDFEPFAHLHRVEPQPSIRTAASRIMRGEKPGGNWTLSPDEVQQRVDLREFCNNHNRKGDGYLVRVPVNGPMVGTPYGGTEDALMRSCEEWERQHQKAKDGRDQYTAVSDYPTTWPYRWSHT
jgi:hypothetical protein